jgi:hypothetical protein
MNQNSFSSAPIQPLSAGNVVSAAFRLYRDYFSTYFKIALEATLWGLFPFLVILPIPFLLLSGRVNPNILWLIIPLWIVLLLYATGKFMATTALIVRLAFGTLVNRPETLQEVRPQIQRKTWVFLRTAILTGLITWGMTIAFYLAIILVGVIGGVVVAGFRDNPIVLGILALLAIVVLFFGLVFLIRFMLRLTITDVPLAIEDNLTATQTISRSWVLTKDNINRIFGIFLLGGLITIPLQVIASFSSNFVQLALLRTLNTTPESPSFIFLNFIISYILGLAIGLILVPFWQAIKATIYYDLRSRKEGLDLELRESEL